LTDRFGPSNERVMALKGMYEEAVAKDNGELEKVLRGYESTLAEDPSNIVRLSPFLFLPLSSPATTMSIG
jgi:hypothetical protein